MTGAAGDEVEGAIDAYVAAWNEPDETARIALLERAVTDDCRFDGPLGVVRGREALAARIAEGREFLPGAVVSRVGPVEPEGGVRFRWRIDSAEGAAVAEGVDLVVVSEGRLCDVTVLRSNG